MSRGSDSVSRSQRLVRRPKGAGSTAPLGADRGAKRPCYPQGPEADYRIYYRINYRV